MEKQGVSKKLSTESVRDTLLIMASLVIIIAGARLSDNEERMAREIREMAYKEVSQDVEEVKGQLEHLAHEVSNIGENVSKATNSLRFLLGLLKK